MRPAALALVALVSCARSSTPAVRATDASTDASRRATSARRESPRPSRQAAVEALQNRGIFAALGAAGGAGSGWPEPNGPFQRHRYEGCSPEELAAHDCVSDDHLSQRLLAQDARTILAASRRPARAAPWPSWDRRTLTPGIRRVADRMGLDTRSHAALRRNGFAVLDRESFDSPYEALREIYRRELPLYVTPDAILHAVFRSHEALVETLEGPLAARLASALARAHAALPAAAAQWPAEVGRDVDLYLTVARSLLAAEAVSPAFADTRAEATRLVAKVDAAAGLAEEPLFGRRRVLDFGIFAPRGPYAEREERRRWFRGATWLSRVEFNVVSRDCRSSQTGTAPDPTETPREALDALALAELLARDDVRDTVARAEGYWSSLAGRREDVPPAELTRLRAAAGITRLDAPDAFERLSRAVGEGFVRTARTHPMPEGVSRLPVIATVLGPRVVPDAAMTWHLVHDAIPLRFDLGAADVALALGHEPAARYLASDLGRFPGLRDGFTRARAVALAPTAGGDLYGAWFEAVRSLARRPPGALPSFMQGRAWDDLRMNSLVAGFAQIRHANVLEAAASYDGAACAIPDAYVDPTPDLYDALLVYVARMRALVARERDWLPAEDCAGLGLYLDEAERTYRVLRRVVADELAGHALTAAQRRFVGSVVEVLPSSMGAPYHTGWYLDLFPGEEPAMKTGAFVTDWYASVNAGHVAYLGVRATRLGLFVVDRGGAPRLMVGPVARAYEHTGGLARRLDDEAAGELPEASVRDPWAASYTVTPTPPPPVSIDDEGLADDDEAPAPRAVAGRFTVRARAPQGTMSVEYLDARGAVVARGRTAMGPTAATLLVQWLPATLRAHPRMRSPAGTGGRAGVVCATRVRLGEWISVAPSRSGDHEHACDVDEVYIDMDTLSVEEGAATR
ncbi:MAG: hypothetical protein JWM10_1497 [Myxococcaceae bacterium]|nr:hypothetical protein [Myxococcaceae bacterium]